MSGDFFDALNETLGMLEQLDPEVWTFHLRIPDPEGIEGDLIISGPPDQFLAKLFEYLPPPNENSLAEIGVYWERRE